MARVRYTNNTSGILILDKPLGITSNTAVQKIKHLLKVNKVGHTGTLDPLASGILPVCVGRATKFSQYLLFSDKSYIFSVKLGIKTTTGDLEGEVLIEEKPCQIDNNSILKVLYSFIGEYNQKVPQFSAVKHKGKPLYYWARKGISIEEKFRNVSINSINLLSYDAIDNVITIRVHCSKGTYVRTLAEDIADKFGTVGCVSYLRRVGVDKISEDRCTTIELLSSMDEKDLLNHIIKIENIMTSYPAVELSDKLILDLKYHKFIYRSGLTTKNKYRLFNESGCFVGIGHYCSDKLHLEKSW